MTGLDRAGFDRALKLYLLEDTPLALLLLLLLLLLQYYTTTQCTTLLYTVVPHLSIKMSRIFVVPPAGRVTHAPANDEQQFSIINKKHILFEKERGEQRRL